MNKYLLVILLIAGTEVLITLVFKLLSKLSANKNDKKNKIIESIYYTNKDDMKHGKCVRYYENGQKKSEGVFFDRYVRSIYGIRESSVLLLKKEGLENLKKHLQIIGLKTFEEQKTTIAIDIGTQQSTSFEANVLAFQLAGK